MTKASYLKKLVEHSINNFSQKSKVNENIFHSFSPPSIFIGSYNYPRVFAGFMITNHENCSIYDMPEKWLSNEIGQEEIIKFRISLLRGKKAVNVNEKNAFTEKLQELALAKNETEIETIAYGIIKNCIFDDEHEPYGASFYVNDFYANNFYFHKLLEKFYYDTDASANTALKELYERNVEISRIIKAFSAGCFGIEKNRKLVPTRWAITAVDKNLGDMLLKNVKNYELLEDYKIFEAHGLYNSYYILLVPSYWFYEWFEAFLHVLSNEELIFNDAEFYKKKEYSSVGGCFYTARFAILEGLNKMQKQAAAFVFREAYKGYVPLGVFNVRELIRKAMKDKPLTFSNFREALDYLNKRLKLPLRKYIEKSMLLKHYLTKRQFGLSAYL
jgi:hypothetical protein